MRSIALGLGLTTVLWVSACGDDGGLAAAARACHGDAEVSCARPIFNVRDLGVSQRYFQDALGFSLDWEDGDPPDFASVSRGDGVLFLCEGCQGTPGAWAMMFVRDVDALYAEIRDRGARIRMAPKTMPWGVRELHVNDPDGNVIRFGTAID